MRLSDCFSGIFSYMLMLQQKENFERITFEQAVACIERLSREGEAQLKNTNATQEDYDLARFAVFAWADETILLGSWPGKTQWQVEPLQRKYYHTSDAGELFFQKLNTIGPHQNHVREVYFICLALGFTGQYHKQGDDLLLNQLKTSNLKLLTGSAVDLPAIDRMTLFPDAYATDQEEVSPQIKKGVSPLTALAFLAPLGLYGVLFFIYKFVLGNIGETIISRIP